MSIMLPGGKLIDRVYICGTHNGNYAADSQDEVSGLKTHVAWELNGIFTAKEPAVARCQTMYDFVASFPLDTPFPTEKLEMEDCEYPLAPKETE